MEEVKEYCYSFNGENFYGLDLLTVEEAIEESKTEYQYTDDGAKFVYIGESLPFKPSIDGIWTCEMLQEQANDVCGEYAEDYLWDVTKEHLDILENRLTKEFTKWAEEFGYEPNFYEVRNVKRYAYKKDK